MDGNEKPMRFGSSKPVDDNTVRHVTIPIPPPLTNSSQQRQHSLLSPTTEDKKLSEAGFHDHRRPTDLPISAKPGLEEGVDEENDCDTEWMRSFLVMKTYLILFGRWPLTYRRETNKKGYNFRFSYTCPGFIFFAFTTLFTICGLVFSGLNVVNILMKEKVSPNKRSDTEIIEQALFERNTVILITMLGAYGVNLVTSLFVFKKSEDTAVTFTRWTHMLNHSKLSSGGFNTYCYVVPAFINFLVVAGAISLLIIYRTGATMIGGPTVVSMMFMRHFLPKDYLDNYVDSTLHYVMHFFGIGVYGYVILTFNSYLYLFLWMLKSVENGFHSWNMRMCGLIHENETFNEDIKERGGGEDNNSRSSRSSRVSHQSTAGSLDVMKKERVTFQLLYRDHIGLVRMLNWLNTMFAYILEPYALVLTIKIVYMIYHGALVLGSNGKVLNKQHLGKYFVRKRDYIAAFLLMYQNCFLLGVILYACAWLEDATYDTYEELRKKSLLKGMKTDKESFFYLSMFQSYTSTTKMSIYSGQFFCISRYSVLHVLSAIMSNFLVVYQFRPLFDMDTIDHENLRRIVGTFLTKLEGLPANHTMPVSDAERSQDIS